MYDSFFYFYSMLLEFLKCSLGEAKELASIGRTTFIDAFKKDNNPIDFDNYIKQAFSVAQIVKELNNSNTFFYLVKENTSTVGYFKVNQFAAQTDIGEDSGLEIERIYVKKAFQGKYVGKKMIAFIKDLAQDLKKDYIWLGVWQKNAAAIRFYENNGFEKFGKHPYYIGRDRQMDWLMKLKLPTLEM